MRVVVRSFLVPIALVGVFSCLASTASAQDRSRDRSNSQFTLRRGDNAANAAEQARARARAGDCKGALTYFDTAIQTSIDPTIRRDRGICFEKLSDPYPAIDDYRYYVHHRPDAADSDQIRERLARLEEQTGTSASSDNRGTKNTESTEVKSASYEALARDTKEQISADDSPLRYGTGVVLGPYAGIRHFFGGGSPDKFGYNIGGSLRYAATRSATLYLDGQYNGIGTTGEASKAGGIGAYFGFELRLHVTRNGSDAILFGAALGYEGYTDTNTQARTYNAIGRGRVGYRHVFGPSVGLELNAEGGPALAFFDNLPLGASKSAEFRFLLGGTLGLMVGF